MLPIRLDEPTWKLLQKVDREVNQNTARATDRENHGIHEHWAIVRNGHGDCDDIALTKRALLHQAGLSLYNLRLALVLTEEDSRHLVLTVDTDRGVVVLDSLNSIILPWEQTRYRWLMRQDGGAIGWVAIKNTRSWQHLVRACPLYSQGHG